MENLWECYFQPPTSCTLQHAGGDRVLWTNEIENVNNIKTIDLKFRQSSKFIIVIISIFQSDDLS